MTQQELDRLFDAARNAPLETSVQQVTEWVNEAAAVSLAGVGSWTEKHIVWTKKAGIMIAGSLAGLGAIGILAYSLITGSGTDMGSSEKKADTLQPPGADKGHIVLETVLSGQSEAELSDPGGPVKLRGDGPSGASAVELKTKGSADSPLEVSDTGADADKPIAGMALRNFIGSIPDSNDHTGLLIHQQFSMSPIRPINGPQLSFMGQSRTLKRPQLFSNDKDMVRESRVVQEFSGIVIKGVIDVILKQGSKSEVVVEATTEQQKKLEISYKGENLVLETEHEKKKGIKRRDEKVKVFITVTDLKEISHSGVGDIQTEGMLEQDDIKINFSGVGDMELQLTCDNLEISLSGVGDTKMEGKALSANMAIRGVGDLDALMFPVQKLDITATGVGNANVHATEELNIEFTGVGRVNYEGEPGIRNIRATGFGKVGKH